MAATTWTRLVGPRGERLCATIASPTLRPDRIWTRPSRSATPRSTGTKRGASSSSRQTPSWPSRRCRAALGTQGAGGKGASSTVTSASSPSRGRGSGRGVKTILASNFLGDGIGPGLHPADLAGMDHQGLGSEADPGRQAGGQASGPQLVETGIDPELLGIDDLHHRLARHQGAARLRVPGDYQGIHRGQQAQVGPLASPGPRVRRAPDSVPARRIPGWLGRPGARPSRPGIPGAWPPPNPRWRSWRAATVRSA
jgi:hypothetical protein